MSIDRLFQLPIALANVTQRTLSFLRSPGVKTSGSNTDTFVSSLSDSDSKEAAPSVADLISSLHNPR